MNRLPLRWMILLPLLATITVGFVIFAVYVEQSDRSTRLAAIDRELARAERVDLTRPVGRSIGRGGRHRHLDAASPDIATVGVDPPVQLIVSPEGDGHRRTGRREPFHPWHSRHPRRHS